MESEYKIVYAGGEAQIIEKKSRFIATVVPVETEEEALAFIESLRKKYWDATHNCYAYVVGERNEIQRCSDDGEPSGTAGRPMMDVLAGAGVHNAAVVVTRYFGGTLLGTGGLIRAYSLAVQEGLAAAEVITRIPGVKLKLTAEYTELGKIQYLLGERGLAAQEAVYTEKVELTVLVPEADAAGIKESLTEETSGRIRIEELGKCGIANRKGKLTELKLSLIHISEPTRPY